MRKTFLLKSGADLRRDFLRDACAGRLASPPLCEFALRACAPSALNGNSHLMRSAVAFLVTLQTRAVSSSSSALLALSSCQEAAALNTNLAKLRRSHSVKISADERLGAGWEREGRRWWWGEGLMTAVRTRCSGRSDGMLPVNTQVSSPATESPPHSPSGSRPAVPQCQETPTLAEPLIATRSPLISRSFLRR